MKLLCSKLLLLLSLLPALAVAQDSNLGDEQATRFNEFLDTFAQEVKVGNCKISYWGNEDGSVNFVFERTLRSRKVTGGMLVTPPQNTSYRSQVRVIDNGLAYFESNVIGWSVFQYHKNSRGEVIDVEIYDTNALEVKIGKSKLLCKK